MHYPGAGAGLASGTPITIPRRKGRASATIAYNIGMVFMHANGKEMAEKHLRIALELNPDSGLLKNALARL